MSEPAHYPIGPSGSSRWLACPGSIDLCRGLESQDSSYAREGTAAHRVAAELLLGNAVDPPTLCNRCNAEVASPPCHVCGSPEYRFDKEMIATLQGSYVAFVQELRKFHDYLEEFVETKIASKQIPEFGGTIDYYAIYRDGITEGVVAHLVDLKYGAGVAVEVDGNTQLLCYALLVRERHPNIKHFRISICQPRVGDGSGVTVDVAAEELDDFRDRVVATTKRDDLAPGDHCRWCAGKAVCPALKQEALSIAAEMFEAPTEADADAHLEHWLHLLSIRKSIDSYLDACEKRVLGEIESGRQVPGWKAVKRWGNRAWASDESEVLKLLTSRKGPDGKKLGLKQLQEKRLKSVAQLDREGLGDVIADLICRSDLGHRLVPESAPGEAVIFSTVEEMFASAPEAARAPMTFDELFS